MKKCVKLVITKNLSSVSEPDDFHEANYELYAILFNFLQSVTTNAPCTNLRDR